MGLITLIGGAVGAAYGQPALGAAAGGFMENLMGGDKKDSQMDEYSAYKLQKEKEWEATYGPIEDNLVNYYSHLSAAKHIANGDQAIEEQFKASQTRLQAELTNRGLDIKGGVSTSILRDNLNLVAQAKAQNHATADAWVADQQANFYNSMRQGKPNAQSALNSANTAAYNERTYKDKQEQMGIAGAIDLGNEIIGGLDLGGTTKSERLDEIRSTP